MMHATALIADDEAAMREQLHARLLEAWPELEVVAMASNGIEAVELAARHQPHIAFLDIRIGSCMAKRPIPPFMACSGATGTNACCPVRRSSLPVSP